MIHLQNGVSKETYGDVLDRFEEVKNYCDSFFFKDQEWKLGSPSVCNWKPEQVLSTLPVIHTCNGKEFIPGKLYTADFIRDRKILARGHSLFR